MLHKAPKLHSRVINLLLIGLLLCILTAGSAVAAPKVCKKNCPPLPSATDTTVFWGITPTSSLFFEQGYRTCGLAQLAPDFSSGTYDCALGQPHVVYNLGPMDWTQTFSRGDPYYCDRAEAPILAAPDLKYSYSWSGDCTDLENGCAITIVNRTGGNTNTMYGSITFEYFIEGVVTDDPNPFTEPLDFMAGHLRVTKFSRKGKDKVLAICEAPTTLGRVTFHTTPNPATPE